MQTGLFTEIFIPPNPGLTVTGTVAETIPQLVVTLSEYTPLCEGCTFEIEGVLRGELNPLGPSQRIELFKAQGVDNCNVPP